LVHRRFYRDQTERRRWQNPDEILKSIGLRPGQTFVDVGSGNGFFAVPAAKIVGENGKVFAVDSDPNAIASLTNKSLSLGLKNIEVRVDEAEDTVFCKACADIVFFGIVLHDFRDATIVLANARKMLGPEGRLVDLDWKKQPMDFGPPLDIRFSEDQAVDLIERAGLRVEMRREIRPFFYLVVARF
jgi:ubiquinone/menaquinone biosynthesis C-methylase UbiE